MFWKDESQGLQQPRVRSIRTETNIPAVEVVVEDEPCDDDGQAHGQHAEYDAPGREEPRDCKPVRAQAPEETAEVKAVLVYVAQQDVLRLRAG